MELYSPDCMDNNKQMKLYYPVCMDNKRQMKLYYPVCMANNRQMKLYFPGCMDNNRQMKLYYQGFQSGPVPGTFTRLRSCIVPAEITEPPKISGGQNHKYDGR